MNVVELSSIASTGGVAVLAAGDPGSTRLVYAMVLGLVLLGAMFVALGIWLIRQTRVDPQMLAPLERMGDKEWRKRDPATQRRMLDDVRPAEARPLHQEPHQPSVDRDFGAARPVASFDDLVPLPAERADATPSGAVPRPAERTEDREAVDAADDATSEPSSNG